MSYFKRFNTVFYKLIVSYITITITVTLLLGSTSYYLFSTSYKKQLIKLNTKMLEYEKNTLTLSVFSRVEALYSSLSTNSLNPKFNDILYFFDHPYEDNGAKIYNISEYLKNLRTKNSEFVDAIHLYIPYSNMIISSTWGVKYLDSENEATAKSIDWLNDSASPSIKGKWISTRLQENSFSLGYGSNIFTYERIYPMFSNNLPKPGIVAIDLNESAISSILRDLNLSSNSSTFIIDGNGMVIFHQDSSKLYSDLNSVSYIKSIHESKKTSDNLTSKVNGVSSMISFISMDGTDWKIVTTTPISEFYKQAAFIQQILIFLCILSIIIGFILTNFFSVKLYNPLKALIALTKNLFTQEKGYLDQNHSNTENEYTLINNLIHKLSYRVVELEKNITEYQPIVKHNLIISLTNNSIPTQEELSERLKLTDINFNNTFFYCMLIKLDKSILSSIGITNSHYIRYNLIKTLETLSDDVYSFLAVEYSCTELIVIVNSKENDTERLSNIITDFNTFSEINFNMQLKFSLSSCSDNLITFSDLYEKAFKTIRYNFYFPEKILLSYEEISERELGSENINSISIRDFVTAIREQGLDSVTLSVDNLLSDLISKNYNADYCNKKLLDLVDALSSHISALTLDPYFNTSNFYSEFHCLKDINHFKIWFISKIASVLELAEQRNKLRNTDAIEKVKEYIMNNLGNQLSLELAADEVNLNAKYLSKLFKDVTGTNFLDYVTDLRLEKSKTLLLTTDLSVDEISLSIGYNTPAYFIKQFKKLYGDTPNNYRKACLIKETSIM
jgi:AraC-like DNA-binding protein